MARKTDTNAGAEVPDMAHAAWATLDVQARAQLLLQGVPLPPLELTAANGGNAP